MSFCLSFCRQTGVVLVLDAFRCDEFRALPSASQSVLTPLESLFRFGFGKRVEKKKSPGFLDCLDLHALLLPLLVAVTVDAAALARSEDVVQPHLNLWASRFFPFYLTNRFHFFFWKKN